MQESELLPKRAPQLGERVEARVDLLLGHRRAVAHERLQLLHLGQEHARELLHVRRRLLERARQFRQVRRILPTVGQLGLQAGRGRLARCGCAVLVRDDVHVLAAHRLCLLQLRRRRRRQLGCERGRLHVQVHNTRAALANVSVEEADAEHDIGELVQLRDLVLVGQRGECLEPDAREDRFERRRDLTLRRPIGSRLEAGAHHEEVEDLPVERGERLDVVARLKPRLRDSRHQPTLFALALRPRLLQGLAFLQPRRVQRHLHFDGF